MDIEQFMSIPNEFSLHIDSEPHELPFNLYNEQSQSQLPLPCNSIDQVLQMMINKQALIDLPMGEIVSDAKENYGLGEGMVGEFVRKVRKTKNIMKRVRAKGRAGETEKVCIPVVEKKEMMWDQSSTEKDTTMMEKEIKKQRNRISAQISRDRKKNYVTNLEQMNKQLAQESETLKLENERLKRQIREKANQGKDQSKPKSNNKFIRLLVLLGALFLMYILKDVFNLKTGKANTNSIMKLEADPEAEVEAQDEEVGAVNMSEHGDIVQEIRSQMSEIEEDQGSSGSLFSGRNSMSLKETILKKVAELRKKTKELILPSRLAMSILQAKNMLLF